MSGEGAEQPGGPDEVSPLPALHVSVAANSKPKLKSRWHAACAAVSTKEDPPEADVTVNHGDDAVKQRMSLFQVIRAAKKEKRRRNLGLWSTMSRGVSDDMATRSLDSRLMRRDLSQIFNLEINTSRGATTDGSSGGSSDAPGTPKTQRSTTGTLRRKISADGSSIIKPAFRVILPHSPLNTVRQLVVLLLALVETCGMPYALAFHTSGSPFSSNGWPQTALILFDVAFLVDMALNFRLAYRMPYSSRLVLEPRKIATHYLKRYFLFDLVAIIPFWAFPNVHHAVALLKLTRLRHIRFLRRVPITSKLYNLYGILVKTLIFILLLHLCTCILVLVIRTTPGFTYSEMPMRNTYLYALYNTFALLLGDAELGLSFTSQFSAQGVHVLPWVLLLLLLGAVICAFLFGSVALQIANYSMSRLKFNERMRVANENMQFYNLPTSLVVRTRTRYEYAWKQYRDLEADAFLWKLSPALKRETCMHLYSAMLRNVTLFAESANEVIVALAERLVPQFFLEDDVLCQEGDVGKEMYFLKCGVVAISQKNRGELARLGAGTYFGEMALLSSKAFGARRFAMDRRTCTVKASTIIDVMLLASTDLESVVADHPLLLTQMIDVAQRRLNELGEVSRIKNMSDLAGVIISTKRLTTRWRRNSGVKDRVGIPERRPSAVGEEIGCSPAPAGGPAAAPGEAHSPAPSPAQDVKILPVDEVAGDGPAPATAADVAALLAAVQAVFHPCNSFAMGLSAFNALRKCFCAADD